MRVPLSWLRDYIDVQLTPEQLAERLTLLGMEVKSIERWGSDWRNVVVGELLEVSKHPRADRLSLTRVTVGSGEPLEIVCGATNIAPGQRVPVALPGAVLPGERRIERTEKMGAVSNGMLCSGEELRLTSDGEGILILPAGTPIGSPLADLYGDVVLDVDVKPNRGDALSLVGLAREVSAATGAPVRLPETVLVESGEPVERRLAVEVTDRGLCPRFVGRWIDDVRVHPSPDHVQMRLLAAGQRPVSNVVDASNYVMVELGKPIHTFDAAAVARADDGRAGIVVRLAADGERLETLDHVARALDRETLLIADRRGPLAIAGVMGGAASEVGEATGAVVVESAIFDPVSIRRTAFRYGLRSEASLRFEKGQEHRLARLGADRTAGLIAEWAGGRVAAGAVDSDPVEPAPERVAFRPARVNRLLGTELGSGEQRDLLRQVGVETEPAQPGTAIPVARGADPLDVPAGSEEAFVASIPSWRRDLAIEADIAEEIARVRGYELVPSVTPDTGMPHFRASPLEVRDAIRETLAGAGLTEVLTHALVSPRLVERFGPSGLPAIPGGEAPAEGDPIRVTNPLSRDHALLRQSLVGSLLEVVATNVRQGRDAVAVFEIGKGYGRRGETAHEWWRLAFALSGPVRPPHPSGPARPWDLDDAKGIVELLCRRLGLGRPRYTPLTDEPTLHPGRSATIAAPGSAGRDGGAGMPADRAVDLAGRLGELHPAVVDELDLRAGRIVVAELAVAGLSGGQLRRIVAEPVPHVPAVERDIAVVVGEGRSAGDVEGVITAHAGPLLRGVTLFDVYRGAPLGTDEKSLAFRLLFQAADRTLTDQELEAAVGGITEALRAELGAHLRT